MSLRERIIDDGTVIRTETVTAFGGESVTITELNTLKATTLAKKFENKDDDSLIHWFIECVVDADTRERLFSKEDIPMIREMRFSDVMKVANAAIKLNKLDSEVASKNSEASPSADSASV